MKKITIWKYSLIIISSIGIINLINWKNNIEKKKKKNFYEYFIWPFFKKLDPELCHKLIIKLGSYNLVPPYNHKIKDENILKIKVFGKEFSNPIGLAAGFDKNGEAIIGLSKLGFGFMEIGTITPFPQLGNLPPRLFRLEEDLAIINRYGFNNDGIKIIKERILKNQKKIKEKNIILGINIGKNKLSNNFIEDYIIGMKNFINISDFLIINISSPNTPGLRNIEKQKDILLNFLMELKKNRDFIIQNDNVNNFPPILLKISPDLSYSEKEIIAKLILETNIIEGIIISNTTITRPNTLQSSKDLINEEGGLSGLPIFELSTNTLKDMYILTEGKIPLIGVGGIFNAKDAYEKIKSGASLIEIYTGLIYKGPSLISEIKYELIDLLKKDGYSSIEEAIGVNVKRNIYNK